MDDWPVENSETVFQCPWFSVNYDDVTTPSGDSDRYYWIDRPQDAVVVVAVDEGSVVLVRQYRPKIEQTLLECPGGHLEDGESYAEAAARELEEETGLVSDDLTHLTTYYPTATTRYERGVVVARDLTDGDPDRDDTEYMSRRYVPVDEAISGSIEEPASGWTLTPLLLARTQGYI